MEKSGSKESRDTFTDDYFKIQNFSVYYNSLDPKLGDDKVVADISLDIAKGEIMGIVGPTGCGKTVLLKAVAGLIGDVDGKIFKGGQDITALKASKRDMSMVFQEYALYPHITAKENILFRFLHRNKFKAHPDIPLEEIVEMLKITEDSVLKRKPKYISGGEKQRVAIGKALSVFPDVLLLDEPLSNIEENLRHSVRHAIKKIVKAHSITALYISHNQIEIAEVADRIAVMYQGRIQQVGTFTELYNNPKRVFVSLFIGEETTNFLKREDVNRLTNGKIDLALTIRPHECTLIDTPDSVALSGEVSIIENRISEKRKIAYIDHGEVEVTPELTTSGLFGVDMPIDTEVAKGDPIRIYIPRKAAKYFDANGDRVEV